MASRWILLHTVPSSGKEFVLDDQAVWTDPIAEFGLACAIREPLRAVFTVFVQDEGVLVRGRLTGEVAVPCTRCAEEAVVRIAQSVEAYEPFPAEDPDDEVDLGVNEEILRFSVSGQGIEMNLAALAWEEFSLALPMKPLCDPNCKGLCASCGGNKNTESCSCGGDALDPRMAPLRGLKVGRSR